MLNIFFGYGFRNYLTSIISFILLFILHLDTSAEFTLLFFIYILFLLPFSIILHFTLYLHLCTSNKIARYYKVKSSADITRKLLPLAILPALLLAIFINYINDWDTNINFRILLINTIIASQFGLYQFVSLYKKTNHGIR
jgi:hypothetical protein